MFTDRTVRNLLACVVVALAAMTAPAKAGVPAQDHSFPTPEMKAFHDVMHPLVHEALPAKDAARIRAAAGDLDAGRSAILRGGTGSATGKAKLEVVKRLEAFNSSVTKLLQASKGTGNDADVLASLDAVHKAFEALVAGWPK